MMNTIANGAINSVVNAALATIIAQIDAMIVHVVVTIGQIGTYPLCVYCISSEPINFSNFVPSVY